MDTQFLPSFTKTGSLQCDNCGMTYDEFVDTGKFGCSHCYDIFADTLDSVFKNIHGSSMHVGRKSRLSSQEKKSVAEDIEKLNQKEVKGVASKSKAETKKENAKNENQEKIEKLNADLKQAIKEERYEDAAKIRDEIKKYNQK